eukprot:177001-Amphidinium_carterae.2
MKGHNKDKTAALAAGTDYKDRIRRDRQTWSSSSMHQMTDVRREHPVKRRMSQRMVHVLLVVRTSMMLAKFNVLARSL